jgi:SOS-response transcriptional repressor LexA
MQVIQEKLLGLSKGKNLAKLSLRDMAEAIGMPGQSPQKIKHHLLQLQKKGFIAIDRAKGTMDRISSSPGWAKGLLHKASHLFSIPIIGTANCGPATIFAEQNFEGILRVSSKLIGCSKPAGLYAIKTNGSAIIDNKGTIKRYIDDRANGQIVLKADSSYDYEPIYLHPDDDFSISGKIVAVIKKPVRA